MDYGYILIIIKITKERIKKKKHLKYNYLTKYSYSRKPFLKDTSYVNFVSQVFFTI